jgi:ABC-2 type transport system ATP-binding protein
MDAIRCENLAKSFGSLAAVDGLSFSVAEGEIFGLVGPDGAGKTTTMRLLTAIMDPTSGDAWIMGRHTVRDAERIHDEIGYMSQRSGLYPDLTVMENLAFYADIYDVPRRGRREKIERLLAFGNLAPFRRRLAGDLSGGMKQKLGLACTLIHTPRVLFLDEPTSGVDPVSRRDFWRLLYQLLREKVTIFVATAYLDEAERASRLALVHAGRLLACGTPDEVKRLMRGTILEIRLAEPRRAIEPLRARFPAASVGLFGDRIHLTTGTPQHDAEQAQAALSAAGFSVERIRPIEPSLEDVFVSVLGGRGDQVTSGITLSPCHPVTLSHTFQGPSMAQPHDQRDPKSPAVLVRDLVKRFGNFVAVDHVSFEVAPGEVFGFLGPNGAGKSTTIRMLCGILPPSSGSGTVGGFDIRTQSEKIKAQIGYMSQKFSLYQDLTVEENIDFYAGIYGIDPRRKAERKEWVIENRRRPTAVLSGGWKQRLALGCAIIHQPPIIFLDEPTSGVDPISRRRFWDLIYELSGRGVTVFVTTHYMDEAEYCDRLALIYRGELIASGTPEVLKTTLMKEHVLEVLCQRPEAAMERIETLPAVKEVALFGKGLHVVAADADAAGAAIRDLLAREGFVLDRWERITPSLEDVFVSLIEARDRAGEAQREVAR